MDGSALSEPDKLAVFDTVTEASCIATQLKVEAFCRAESQIGGVLSNRPRRSLMRQGRWTFTAAWSRA